MPEDKQPTQESIKTDELTLDELDKVAAGASFVKISGPDGKIIPDVGNPRYKGLDPVQFDPSLIIDLARDK
jgi:hypothetical protein